MDASLQELERAFLADPSDQKALVAWYQASVRAGWTHEGKTLADWTKDLGKAKARTALVENAEEIGARLVPALLPILDDKRAPVRGAALEALLMLGDWSRSALEPAQKLAAKDRSLPNRALAARVLGALGAEAAPAVPTLIKCLDHTDDELKHAALLALGQVGPAAAVARDKLADLATKDELWFVPDVLESLEKIGVDASIIPTLEAVFEHGQRMSREVAIRMAMDLGDAGRKLSTWILGQLRDVDRVEEDYSHEFRLEAIKFALREADRDPAALEALYNSIHDPDPPVRAAAAAALIKTKKADAMVKKVLELLASDMPIERNRAAEALGNMAPASVKPALDPLIKALDDSNHWVVSRAAEALGKFGAPAKAALPKLKALAKGKRKLNREFAEAALESIEG